MGLQELLWGVGAVVLLGVLIFAVMRGNRRPSQQPAADQATRRNFDKL
ncbi:MAG: hypothetical protein KIT76_00915 [Pseudolabrys sp.]|jgi:hypothetical protein|nr:hypothetical protein [Pseudolabrys sp.]MCW5690946.1 hypothetical protein [Pseudolabrys sp.]